MAYPMTRLEWVAILVRGATYDGAWVNYLKEGDKHP